MINLDEWVRGAPEEPEHFRRFIALLMWDKTVRLTSYSIDILRRLIDLVPPKMLFELLEETEKRYESEREKLD